MWYHFGGGGGGVVAQSCPTLVTLWTAAYQVLHPWDFPGESTGVRCHCLLHSTLLQKNKFFKGEFKYFASLLNYSTLQHPA